MLTIRRRKWHSYSLALLLAFFLLLCGLFYVIRHRFNRVLEYIVQQESKGSYAFRADQMEVSLWHRRIIMENASLVYLDTLKEATHYDVHIPEIYFSIASWKALLIDKKLIIDSFSVVRPYLQIYGLKKNQPVKSKPFHPTDLLTYLEQTLEHLNARSLSIRDASFTCEANDSPPIHGEQINLSLTNFTHVNNEDSHVLGSDNVEFSMGKQDWPLAGGNQEIHFNRLSFKSKNQQVEIDSFHFRQKAAAGQGPLEMRADKFFFNSRHLPAVYQKAELLIDTLYCLRPSFSVPGQEKEKPAMAIASAPDIRGQLFHRVHIRFVQVVDGKLSLTNKDGSEQSTVASKTNLSVYNLTLDPSKTPRLSTDSVRVNISKIRFLSKDSLFQLDINEFAVNQNDVVFSHILFEPAAFNHSSTGILFKAPALLLHDVDMEALMHKRIQAGSAELILPEISYHNTGPPKNTKSTNRAQNIPASLHQTLRGLSQLIDVREFYIRNGSFLYSSAQGLTLRAKDIHARILPNQLFLSDSLLDIKHAIPELRVSQVDLHSKDLQLSITNYIFQGTREFNRAQNISASLQNGSRFGGRNISWTSLDWDRFQGSREIVIRELQIDDLSVRLKKAVPTTGQKKDLPSLQIGSLTVKQGDFSLDGPNANTHFGLLNVTCRQIVSGKQMLNWDRLNADLPDFRHQGKQFSFSAEKIHLDNRQESLIQRFFFTAEGGTTRFSTPEIRIVTQINSADLKNLAIQEFHIDQADLNIYTEKKKPSVGRSAEWPVDLDLNGIAIDHLHFHIATKKENDSSVFQGSASLTGDHLGLQKGRDLKLRFGKIGINVKDFQTHLRMFDAGFPLISLKAENGTINGKDRPSEIAAALNLQWKDGTFRYAKDSTEIIAQNLTGQFEDAVFRAGPQPLVWQQLLGRVSAGGTGLSYHNKKTGARIGNFSWSGSRQELNLLGFELSPLVSREESFRTANWQNDYMTVKGKSITVSGIRWPQRSADSVLEIHRVLLNDLSLNTYRDRRVPFHHGIEKPMPTRLIHALILPIAVDTVWLGNSEVKVHELSTATGQWSEIPLEGINGYVTNINSRYRSGDQLSVKVSGQLFQSPISLFSYVESYGDSLSRFKATALLTHADLSRFSPLTMPMAALRIKTGRADTVYSRWEGNKYASTGDMHLVFRYLRIRLYDKKDSSRRGLMPTLKTWVANILLPAYHDKLSPIFVERDREKFVFNYWVKAQTSGFLSSLGLKKAKNYRKQYDRKAAEYKLPTDFAIDQK